MKSKIEANETGLSISVEQVGKRRRALLQAFRECQEGRCSCPTTEYEKLESIDVQSDEDAIHIHLKPKSGETVDEPAVQECLDYTVRRATAE